MSTQVINEKEMKMTISLPRELHTLIKSQAVLNHTSIKTIIQNAIIKSFNENLNDATLNNQTQNEVDTTMKEYKSGDLQSFSNAHDALSFLNS